MKRLIRLLKIFMINKKENCKIIFHNILKNLLKNFKKMKKRIYFQKE